LATTTAVSSNFERFFYEIANRDSAKVTEWMNKFNETGVLDIPQDIHAKACSIMASYAVSGARLGLAPSAACHFAAHFINA
jgi:hypothetical protein